MKTIVAFMKKKPVPAYYLMVFTISWGGLLVLTGGRVPGTKEQVDGLFPLALLILFAGPSISGLLMTALVFGKAGFRNYSSRLLKWRVGIGYWAAALLTGPVLVAAVLLALSLVSKDYLPGIVGADNKIALLVFGVAWGLVGGGLLEETGWTGFAVPQLRKRYGVFTTGLIAGVLWGLWHCLIAYWSSGSLAANASTSIFVSGFLLFYFCALPAYRVFLVWLHDRTGSLLLTMVMHAGLSSSCLILQPASTGTPYLVWNLALAALMWIVVVINRKRITR